MNSQRLRQVLDYDPWFLTAEEATAAYQAAAQEAFGDFARFH